jgi:ABC-type dipeptide/oligopeptide/nickel transport system permease subunit
VVVPALVLLGVACLALFAGIIAPHDPNVVRLEGQLQPPSLRYPLGTDQFGRCVLSRLIYGARTTLGAATVVLLASSAAAASLAAASLRPRLRAAALRLLDLGLALPSLVVAIAVVGLLGPGTASAMLAVGVTSWPAPARLVRALLVQESSAGYVLAARALGASPARIIWRHVARGVAGRVAVVAALSLGRIVLAFSSLSFLGLGPQPPVAEWGAMLQESRLLFFRVPALMIWPGLALALVVGAATALAEGLAAAMDERPPH